MQRPFLSRLIGIGLLLSLFLHPGSGQETALAEPAALPDDEIIYIDGSNVIRVIDPHTEPAKQRIEWYSPEGNWFDFATGDFNNDGDKEIVAIGGGRLTVFDPVVRDSGIVPDGDRNLVPWVRLHERALNGADIIGAGNLDQNVPGDEIVVGYNVSEPNGVNYRVDVLKTSDGGRTWTTHISQAFGAKWTYIAVGNINNTGSEDLLLGRNTANDSLVEAHEVDNNFATIFSRNDSTLFTQRSGAVGQVYAGGTGEAVLLRTFGGTSEAAVLLIYQFTNNSWQIVEDPNNAQTDDSAHYFPHPFQVVTGDVNGNGDDEIFWLRDGQLNNTGNIRLAMINRGNDTLPAFESTLDADNGYRVLAMGDVEGDGRDELAAMRNNRIRVFSAVETGNVTLFDDHSNILTNNRSLKLANLDGDGFTAGARFSASPTSLSVPLVAGTKDTAIRSIQLTNIGSGGNLPITVSKELGSTWFDFSLGASTTPASIFVGPFDASKLAPGTYKDRLKVTSSNGNVLNQPFYIPIEMVVSEASFNIAPSAFALATSKSEAVTTTQTIDITGLPGLTFSAAILSQPEFNAAVAALGSNPTSGWFSAQGALVLSNGSAEYTTSVSRAAGAARSVDANTWPSALPWATATSAGSVAPGQISVAIASGQMTEDAGKGLLIVVADERAGTFPDNLRMAPFVVVRTDTPLFLAPIAR